MRTKRLIQEMLKSYAWVDSDDLTALRLIASSKELSEEDHRFVEEVYRRFGANQMPTIYHG